MQLRLNPAQHDAHDWVRAGVLYQVFPDRLRRDSTVIADRALCAWTELPDSEQFFGGNLRGITQALPELALRGVRSVYLNPIFRARSNHRYDTENYFEIDPLLGSSDDLRVLCAEARKHSIGVILDGVFNHVGREFAMFQRAVGGDPEAAGWFTLYPDGSYQTFGGADALPKLNTDVPAVLDLVESVIRHWDQFGISGWRFDVPYKVPREFWAELRRRTSDVASAQFVIAEAWQEWSFAESFESVQNYLFGKRIVDFVVRHAADAEDFLLDVTRWAQARPDWSLLANHIDSHDTQRFMNACEGDREKFLLGFALHMMLPGVPIVYYGTELGMEGATDPDCRRTYPTSLTEAQEMMLERTEPLMRLRATHEALSHGGLTISETKNHAFVAQRESLGCLIEFAANSGWRDELMNTNLRGPWQSLNGPVELDTTIAAGSFQYRVLRCACA